MEISDVIKNNREEKGLKRGDAVCSTHNLVPPKKDITDSEREKAFAKMTKDEPKPVDKKDENAISK